MEVLCWKPEVGRGSDISPFPGCSAEPLGVLGNNFKTTRMGPNDFTNAILLFGVALSAPKLLWPISNLSSGGRHPAGWVQGPLCGHAQHSRAAWPSGLRLLSGVSSQ